VRHLFEFELTPVEGITPWGEAPDLRLHWFGLTDGFYYLDLGTTRLLEYVDPKWGRHVGYQVSRLHEDVLEMLPDVLLPIPHEVIALFPERSIIPAVQQLRRASDALAEADHDADTLFETLSTLGERGFDTSYLAPSANIWIWSHDAGVVVEWDNRDRLRDEKPVWTASHGRYEIERAAFIEEVRSLDRRLMESMAERVDAACSAWPRPDVALDRKNLRWEQQHRGAWLDSALRRPPTSTDWALVRAELSRRGRAR
jgi:hypothetical protein